MKKLLLFSLAISYLSISQAQTSTATPPNQPPVEMVQVPGGTFIMGCINEPCAGNAKPAHKVRISNFSIGKYEVTQAEWKTIMGSNPSSIKGNNFPVDNIGWQETQEFIQKLNAITGKNYRLPTEAEWEYAARGGNKSKGYQYSGSETASDVAWYYDNSSKSPHPVGTKRPNELGVYDMSGNVFEWCSDWYSDNYDGSEQKNPTGDANGTMHIIRGGAWAHYKGFCTVYDRYFGTPDKTDGYKYMGLRLAMSK